MHRMRERFGPFHVSGIRLCGIQATRPLSDPTG